MSLEFEEKVLNEFKIINQKLDKHEKKLNEHDKKFDAIDKKFDDVDNKLDFLTKSIEKITNSLVLIEQKITFDIPALFNGYSMQHNIQERQQVEINSLNQKVDSHDIRISILEQKSV